MKEVPPVFIPPRKYNTAKRRAEAEALARGEVLPPSTSSKKRQRVAAGESEPPEEGMSQGEGDSGDDYEGEGSVPPAGRTPSVPPPAVLDPFGLPLMVPKVEEMAVADPFAIPGSTTVVDGRSPSATPGGVDLPPLPPLPTLPALPHQASPALVSPYPPQQQQGYDLAPPAMPMAFSAPSPLGLNGTMPSPPAGNGIASSLDTGKPRLLARVKVNGREPGRFPRSRTPTPSLAR